MLATFEANAGKDAGVTFIPHFRRFSMKLPTAATLTKDEDKALKQFIGDAAEDYQARFEPLLKAVKKTKAWKAANYHKMLAGHVEEALASAHEDVASGFCTAEAKEISGVILEEIHNRMIKDFITRLAGEAFNFGDEFRCELRVAVENLAARHCGRELPGIFAKIVTAE